MGRIAAFFRRRTEKAIDDVVAAVLTRLENTAIRPWLAKLRRRATRDFGIGAGLLLLALGVHFLTANDALALALVAAACWYSIVVFVWNRVSDVRTYLRYKRPIDEAASVAVPAFFRARLGMRFHAAGEALYDAIYEGRLTFENAGTGKVYQVGSVVRGVHRAASALGLTPDKRELFEQVYAQMLRLFRRLARALATGVLGFLLAYAVLTSVVRVVVEDVLPGAHLSKLFDPIVFPVVYVIRLFAP